MLSRTVCNSAINLFVGLNLIFGFFNHTYSQTNTFSFAVIGDQPYSDYHEKITSELLNTINQDRGSSFALHVGDIKGGSERCDDSLLNRRFELLRKSQTPIVFTPGDNEWVDCHRESNGQFIPLERLEFLRKKVFNKDESLGRQPFSLSSNRDQGFPELLRWQVADTLFVTLNLQGSNNNLAALEASTDEKVAFSKRVDANSDWLESSKKYMQTHQIAQWVIIFHGNAIDGSGQSIRSKIFSEDGFAETMKAIAKVANDVNKPLLIIHGDTHLFKFDQPDLIRYGFEKATNDKTWRLEAWGHPFVEKWVRVSITPNANPPFSASSVSMAN